MYGCRMWGSDHLQTKYGGRYLGTFNSAKLANTLTVQLAQDLQQLLNTRTGLLLFAPCGCAPKKGGPR